MMNHDWFEFNNFARKKNRYYALSLFGVNKSLLL